MKNGTATKYKTTVKSLRRVFDIKLHSEFQCTRTQPYTQHTDNNQWRINWHANCNCYIHLCVCVCVKPNKTNCEVPFNPINLIC